MPSDNACLCDRARSPYPRSSITVHPNLAFNERCTLHTFVKRAARSLALKAAYRDVSIGFTTGITLIAFRILAFAGFLSRSADPVSFLGSLLSSPMGCIAVSVEPPNWLPCPAFQVPIPLADGRCS